MDFDTLIMKCQRRLINCRQCNSLTQDVDGEGVCAFVGVEKSLYLVLGFVVNIKLL